MGGAQGGQAREGAEAQRALGPLSPLQRGRAAADGPNRSAGEAPSWSFFFSLLKKYVTEQYDSSYISCLFSFFKKLK